MKKSEQERKPAAPRENFASRLGIYALSAVIALLFSLTFGNSQALATTIYNNLSSPTAAQNSVQFTEPIGDSFSTGSSTFLLNGVTVLVGAAAPSDGGSVSVELLSSTGHAPGGVLDTIGTISDSSLPLNSLTGFSLSLSTPFSLAAGTMYWIELSTSHSSAYWAYSLDMTAQGVAGEYAIVQGNVFANGPDSGAYQMELSGPTAAAEPGAFTLLLVALGAFGLYECRRRFVAQRGSADLRI